MTLDSKTIKRRKAGQDPYSFESLRLEGIRYSQAFSGDAWSDYNTHDPGVTILEQLCYGLTELIYRTDFAVEDYLVDPQGRLDLEYLGLVPAEEILPCRPCTLSDYRQAIFDAVDEIEQVWIRPADHAFQGLYLIEVQLTDKVRQRCQHRPALKQMVTEKVSRIYAKLRNLCEDVLEVNIIDDTGYQLLADIDIHEESDANDILAELYFCTDRWLKGQGKDEVQSYEDQLNRGNSLDEILNGPRTVNAPLSVQDPNSDDSLQPKARPLSALRARLMAISGVERINDLALEVLERETSQTSAESPLISEQAWLYVPQSQEEFRVSLKRSGHGVPLSLGQFNVRFEQKEFKQNTIRYTRQETASLYLMPQGQYRQLGQYCSIQQHFPVTYHLNVQGISSSVGSQEWVKIKQLKGYLLIFEQLMANFSANLAGVRQLFSVDISQEISYQLQLINGETVKGIEQLYPPSPQQIFTQILADFDCYSDRKSRLLDYLLALYGEQYQDKNLGLGKYYQHQQALEHQQLKNKANYLKSIVSLGKDRGGALDYSRVSLGENNRGGFFQRLAFHLGMNEALNWPYTHVLRQLPLKLIPDDKYPGSMIYLDHRQLQQLRRVPLIPPPLDFDARQGRKMKRRLSPLRSNVICESLFQKGMDISYYQLIASDKKQGFDVLFQMPKQTQQHHAQAWLYIGHVSTQAKAGQFVALFRRYIIYLNQASEGFHLVEHILLREEEDNKENQTLMLEEDDYSFVLSVVMPAYSARCSDPAFQTQAQAIIREQCPAHILPLCRWLDFDAMCEFEILYRNYLEQRRSCISRCNASIQAGSRLMAFLQSHPGEYLA